MRLLVAFHESEVRLLPHLRKRGSPKLSTENLLVPKHRTDNEEVKVRKRLPLSKQILHKCALAN